MSALGFSAADFEEEPIGIWPDNWTPFSLFVSLGTQWRIGMSGATGLDYGVLRDVMQMHSIPRRDWPETFSSIQVMEDEALKAMHEKRK